MFGRRTVGRYGQPPAGPDVPLQQMAYQANSPVVPCPPTQYVQRGEAGWRGMGVAHPSDQIGAYAGGMLNQFPAILPGVQLKNGREGNNSSYYTPTAFPVMLGGLSQTTNPNNLPGGQRYGSIYGGPIGPLTAQGYSAAVTAAQVRQSGLAMMSWAKALSPTYGGS